MRERALRLVTGARAEDLELSLNAAVVRIGSRVGVNADTLRGWCKQADFDAGKWPGTTSDDAKTINELKHEVKELWGGSKANTTAPGLRPAPHRPHENRSIMSNHVTDPPAKYR
ncbi:MAG: hypothetical protein H0U51_10345 [Propionibacteriales bacterium]|nr:hypothetical protein [Propionibacteriales bacterium]